MYTYYYNVKQENFDLTTKMCGILAILGECLIQDEALKKLETLIDKRGPDFNSPLIDHATTCKLNLKLKASILHLRGDVMQKQPCVDAHNNALVFNGQIYAFNGEELDKSISDTSFLIRELMSGKSSADIVDIFSKIDGPFSFIYWRDDLNTIFYGRDIFGRKSLCTLVDGSSSYPCAISTLAIHGLTEPFKWDEVDCSGFYSINFSEIENPKKSRYLWNIDAVYPSTNKCLVIKRDPLTEYLSLQSLPLEPLNSDSRLPEEFCDEDRKLAMDKFDSALVKSIDKRLKFNRKTCLQCREARSVDSSHCSHSKVAVAFSGGIDSTYIAHVLDRVFDKSETIDLLTVAFKADSPDRGSVGCAFKELRRLCPNRNWRLVLCDITKSELQTQRDEVIRHLIEPCKTVIDDSIGCGCWFISRAEGRALDSSICDEEFEKCFESFLEYKTTYLYESMNDQVNYSYASPATIFFAGMSIDEQLGGYSSFRSAWSKAGLQGLHDEISFQMRRIPTRNLGRDDRTCSHHSRDVKLPYLDFGLVSYLNQLPVGLKMNLAESQDIGPKKLLRDLAFSRGLSITSRRVKRALQFGTRIANLENSKEKGDDECCRLK